MGLPDLGYAEPLERLSGGFETDILTFRLASAPAPLDIPLVLRVFRPGTSQNVRHEAAVQEAAAAHGFPAPRTLFVDAAGEAMGRPFLVLERLPGRPLVDGLLRPPSRMLLRAPELLAGAMLDLHRLPIERVTELFEGAALDRGLLDPDRWDRKTRRLLPRIGGRSLNDLAAWIDARRPDLSGRTVFCHGDYHPANLLLHRGRISGLVDWTRASLAPPEFELGNLRILLGYGPVGLPRIALALLAPVRRRIQRRLETLYRERSPIDDDRLLHFEMRRALSALAGVAARRLSLEAEAGWTDPYPFDNPSLPELLARVEKVSGIRVELPPPPSPGWSAAVRPARTVTKRRRG
ncbi:MAG TPA: phosphotransferase [Thermoanaerobaculia bacterium]|nr:phosphotransferase [Thermoanaerobaculia bacterium]